jgi:hypothetical protein
MKKKLLAFAIPLLTVIGCSSPLAPEQDENSLRVSKVKEVLEEGTRDTKSNDRLAVN